MNIYLIFAILILFATIRLGQAYALEYTYPTINQRLTEIPTYCAVESISDKINPSEMEQMIIQSAVAVKTWEDILQDSESVNKEFWDINF